MKRTVNVERLELLIVQLGEMTAKYVTIVSRPPHTSESYIATDKPLDKEQVGRAYRDGTIPKYQESRTDFMDSLRRRLVDARRGGV